MTDRTRDRVDSLDEMTAALPADLAENVLKTVGEQRDTGRSVIFISHRLAEVFEVAEKITVLKDGQFVGTVKTEEVTPEDIVYMMVGYMILCLHDFNMIMEIS